MTIRYVLYYTYRLQGAASANELANLPVKKRIFITRDYVMADWEDKIEIVSDICKCYDIEITNEEFLTLVKVDDLVKMVITKLQEKPDFNGLNKSVVWQELQPFIADQLGVTMREVQLETSFYEDLNCGGKSC